jgi:hypothetical protein
MSNSDYNKIISTITSVSQDYTYSPDPNNLICIDSINNRIGINTIEPLYSLHISGGKIICNNLFVSDICRNGLLARISALRTRIEILESPSLILISNRPGAAADTYVRVKINNINNSDIFISNLNSNPTSIDIGSPSRLYIYVSIGGGDYIFNSANFENNNIPVDGQETSFVSGTSTIFNRYLIPNNVTSLKYIIYTNSQ